MNVEIGTETPIFLFWEFLFQNFGILSLQCDIGLTAGQVLLQPHLRGLQGLYTICWSNNFIIYWVLGAAGEGNIFLHCVYGSHQEFV
jgi:hypothetical protein